MNDNTAAGGDDVDIKQIALRTGVELERLDVRMGEEVTGAECVEHRKAGVGDVCEAHSDA